MADALPVARAILLILFKEFLNENTEGLLPLIACKYLYRRIQMSKKFHPVQDSE